MDVKHRIKGVWMKWREVLGVLYDKKIPMGLKGQYYRSIMRHIINILYILIHLLIIDLIHKICFCIY
jgi:hypothetical protein